MHRNSIFRKGALYLIISIFFLSACNQSTNSVVSSESDDDNGGYASDGSRIELFTDDAISIADAAGTNYNRDYIGAEGCVTVATDTISSPHVLIVRFGGCTCSDGRTRSGAIIVSYNGEYTDTNKVRTITFDNYEVNSTRMSGTIKYIRVDTTITGNWYYKVSVNDSLNMSLDPLQSKYVVWSGSLVRKWVQGAETLDRTDDIFSISGSTTLTRPNLHQFSFGISTPVQIALNCDYAESGVINISGYTGTRVLNYGVGTCDPHAQYNVGTSVYTITLTK